jgi:hypothetical protein
VWLPSRRFCYLASMVYVSELSGRRAADGGLLPEGPPRWASITLSAGCRGLSSDGVELAAPDFVGGGWISRSLEIVVGRIEGNVAMKERLEMFDRAIEGAGGRLARASEASGAAKGA